MLKKMMSGKKGHKRLELLATKLMNLDLLPERLKDDEEEQTCGSMYRH